MRTCPVCADTPLVRLRYEGFIVLRCPTCGGTLLEDPKVAAIERKMELSEKQLVAETAPEAPDSSGPLRCPKCRIVMTKAPALKSRPEGFRSDTIKDFDVDHCKYCGLTWFDGGELAKLQLSYERSAKGQESKQHYVRFADLDEAQKAEYGRVLAEASRGSGDALCEGFVAGLVEVAQRLGRALRTHRP